MNLTTVGIFARIEIDQEAKVRERLQQLEGVELFELPGGESAETGQLGLLVEAESIEAAHDKIRHEITATAGVLCAWPVYVDFGIDDKDADFVGMGIKPSGLEDLCAPT